jgi:hypothetical protein
MTESVVLSELDGRGVATVAINRPAVNNAYNGAVIEGLASHGKMNVSWRGQAHRIEIGLRQHLAVIGENVRDTEFPGDSLSACLLNTSPSPRD